MPSQEYMRRNHLYLHVIALLSEQTMPERGSPELRALVEQILNVTDSYSGMTMIPASPPEGVGDVIHTAAFAALVERAGLLAAEQWPCPLDLSDVGRALYWPGVFALLVARAEAAHKELT